MVAECGFVTWLETAFETYSVDIPENIKEFDNKHGATWHCIFCRNFVTFPLQLVYSYLRSSLPEIEAPPHAFQKVVKVLGNDFDGAKKGIVLEDNVGFISFEKFMSTIYISDLSI
ncbi:unnamed protein product [Thlaspi arvense]|uniref:Uncharacterized protein n=1 Tax=Thlaspi arvense TaxID=13288 RepID=A0AAU9SAY7_THLAR|nr:unnamed protein product [Thlaspi arvense]